MQIPSKAYDILKWVAIICLPAASTAYAGLSSIWGLPYGGELAQTLGIVSTLLGVLLGISSATHYKEINAEQNLKTDYTEPEEERDEYEV